MSSMNEKMSWGSFNKIDSYITELDLIVAATIKPFLETAV
jgi:hypothetical protein